MRHLLLIVLLITGCEPKTYTYCDETLADEYCDGLEICSTCPENMDSNADCTIEITSLADGRSWTCDGSHTTACVTEATNATCDFDF